MVLQRSGRPAWAGGGGAGGGLQSGPGARVVVCLCCCVFICIFTVLQHPGRPSWFGGGGAGGGSQSGPGACVVGGMRGRGRCLLLSRFCQAAGRLDSRMITYIKQTVCCLTTCCYFVFS